jgi:MoaA/NifB/PqqE/SkfB family radical SAM enzyme
MKFIDDCSENGIERVGFSGGEPFLNLNFIRKISQKVIEKELFFGKIFTNAVWWSEEKELVDKLNLLFDGGFDGKITVSLDKFHNQDLKKVEKFIETAYKIRQYNDLVSFAAVKDGDDEITKKMLEYFKKYELKTDWIDYIPQDFNDEKFWQSPKWFKDDFCKGPGNVFYVHDNGDIAGCCGYANEEKGLILGNIAEETYESLMKNAQKSEIMNIAYGGGFEEEIRKLENDGKIFGKTDKHCLFCRKLIELKREKVAYSE